MSDSVSPRERIRARSCGSRVMFTARRRWSWSEGRKPQPWQPLVQCFQACSEVVGESDHGCFRFGESGEPGDHAVRLSGGEMGDDLVERVGGFYGLGFLMREGVAVADGEAEGACAPTAIERVISRCRA